METDRPAPTAELPLVPVLDLAGVGVVHPVGQLLERQRLPEQPDEPTHPRGQLRSGHKSSGFCGRSRRP